MLEPYSKKLVAVVGKIIKLHAVSGRGNADKGDAGGDVSHVGVDESSAKKYILNSYP